MLRALALVLLLCGFGPLHLGGGGQSSSPQTIIAVSPTGTLGYSSGIGSGVVLSAVGVTMNPPSPLFNGTLALTNPDGTAFPYASLSSTTLPSNIVTNSSTPTCTTTTNYNANIVATEPSAGSSSPFIQSIIIQCSGTPPPQTITSVSPSSASYITGIVSGTQIGAAIAVTMSTDSFTGSLSLTGTNAADFALSSTTLPSYIESNGSTPTCSSNTNYNVNIVATQSGATGSPYTQPVTITCTPSPVVTSITFACYETGTPCPFPGGYSYSLYTGTVTFHTSDGNSYNNYNFPGTSQMQATGIDHNGTACTSDSNDFLLAYGQDIWAYGGETIAGHTYNTCVSASLGGLTYVQAVQLYASLPAIGTVSLSGSAFLASTPNAVVGTLSAALANGGMTGFSYSIVTGTANDGTTCNSSGPTDFQIVSGTTVETNSSGLPAGNYPGVCVKATNAGASPTTYIQEFNLFTGQTLTLLVPSQYSTISAAVTHANADSNPTDLYRIDVSAGTYTNDDPVVTRNMTIEAAVPAFPPNVILNSTTAVAHGVVELDSGTLLLDDVEIEGATASGGNGAGVAANWGSATSCALVVRNSLFIGNQAGILTTDNGKCYAEATNNLFLNTGSSSANHAIYFGNIESGVARLNEICGMGGGYGIKAHTGVLVADYNTIYTGVADPNSWASSCRVGTGNYAIGASLGGAASITNNYLYGGSAGTSSYLVEYGNDASGSLPFASNTIEFTLNYATTTMSGATLFQEASIPAAANVPIQGYWNYLPSTTFAHNTNQTTLDLTQGYIPASQSPTAINTLSTAPSGAQIVGSTSPSGGGWPAYQFPGQNGIYTWGSAYNTADGYTQYSVLADGVWSNAGTRMAVAPDGSIQICQWNNGYSDWNWVFAYAGGWLQTGPDTEPPVDQPCP